MELLKNEKNNNVLINIENDFNVDATWEENIKNYEQETLKSIINPILNFETSKYTHEPYVGGNGILQDDIWFYFYFYSDSGTTHSGGLNYEYVGLSLEENSKLTINTTESFFRLDFFKIPTLEDSSLDYLNKKLAFTKNLRIPLGEKVYFKPIHNDIYVPVFRGSTLINEENMTFFWFDDESSLADKTLTGNTFYMSAKYFNSVDGSIYNFTNQSLADGQTIMTTDGDDIITNDNNEIRYLTDDDIIYYKVTVNKTDKTYYVTGIGRNGTSNSPIKFYSNTLPDILFEKYTPMLNVLVTFFNTTTYLQNDGSITIIVHDVSNLYKYELYIDGTFFNSISLISNTYTFSELHGSKTYKIVVTLNDGRKYTTSGMINNDFIIIPPEVITFNHQIILPDNAVLYGSITNLGNTPILSCGFRYGIINNAGGTDNFLHSDVGVPINVGGVSKTVFNLSMGTTYIYQTYVETNFGYFFGEVSNFGTLSHYVERRQAQRNYIDTVVKVWGGTPLLYDMIGVNTITEYGFYFGENSDYNLNTKYAVGTAPITDIIGLFDRDFSNISLNTNYYYSIYNIKP